MTLDNLSGGLYAEDVAGPVTPRQATSCGGLAGIQGDTTRGVLSSPLPPPGESKRGGQVFSQHMSLTTACAAAAEDGWTLRPD